MSQWLPGIVLVLIGLVLLAMGIVSRARAKRTQTWPTALATVLHSEVKQHTRYDSDSHSRKTSYQPVVNYQYNVLGQSLTGSRIGYGNSSASLKKANETVSRYPAGAQVNVHYNPDKIDEAALEATAPGSVSSMIIGAVLVVLGLVVLIIL